MQIQPVIPAERIETRIYLIRSQRVMLSRDLAVLYGVEARSLIQAMKRNLELKVLEERMTAQDEKFGVVFDAIRELIEESDTHKRKPPIGYLTEAGAKQSRRRRSS